MANKILKYVTNMNKPVKRILLVKGWNYRLQKKIRNGYKLRELTQDEKRQVKEYWSQFGKKVNPNWAAYFSYKNDLFDPRYIPESLFYGEIAQGLFVSGMAGLHHKNMQEQIFNAKQPRTIVRKINNFISDINHTPITINQA